MPNTAAVPASFAGFGDELGTAFELFLAGPGDRDATGCGSASPGRNPARSRPVPDLARVAIAIWDGGRFLEELFCSEGLDRIADQLLIRLRIRLQPCAGEIAPDIPHIRAPVAAIPFGETPISRRAATWASTPIRDSGVSDPGSWPRPRPVTHALPAGCREDLIRCPWVRRSAGAIRIVTGCRSPAAGGRDHSSSRRPAESGPSGQHVNLRRRSRCSWSWRAWASPGSGPARSGDCRGDGP